MYAACSRYVCTYTGDTGDGFAARKIGDVDEGVVEGSEDTGNAENKLALLKRSIRVPTLAPAV